MRALTVTPETICRSIGSGGSVPTTMGWGPELAPVLADLNPRLGVYACLGNHDLWTDEELVRTGLEESGLPLLGHRTSAP